MSSLNGVSVLVTGADGFIGSHLVERLVELGARVRAFCLYNSQGSWGWLDRTPPDVRAKLEVRLGDIRDARFVEDACKGVDVVFHLAALIAIPYSYSAPESFVDTNISGTLNVLEAARRQGVKRVIQTSTSEVYGTPESTPIRETHSLNAQSPYAATKVAADQLALAFFRSFKTPVVVLRPFNTFGPRQSTRAVLPTILLQLIEGKTELTLGRTDTRRDMTYVSDTVEGFVLAALANGIEGETIQLGTGMMVSIQDMVDVALKITGRHARVVTDERRLRPDASEVLVLLSDPSRAKSLLGWEPRVSFEAGLSMFATWLKTNRDAYQVDYLHV
jgi:NAD dependent epimerase/dehydratase